MKNASSRIVEIFILKNILTIFFLITGFFASGQKTTPDVNIEINGHPSMGNPFSAYIKISDNSIKVIVSKVDSIRYTALRKDQEYQSLIMSDGFKNINISDSAGHKLIQQITTITKSYTVFTTDSIIVSKKASKRYILSLDSILATPTDILLKENKYRIIFDGISFGILIKKNGSIVKDLLVRNPQKDYYPQLYQLIIKSFAIYRDKRPGSFFDKKVTYTY